MDTQLTSINTSDVINIIGIVITSVIGIWIGTGVQKSLTKKRYLRDYFIGELSAIREEYRLLFSDIIFEKIDSKTIKDRLKIMSARISSFDKYLNTTFNIEDNQLKNEHSNFQQFITGEDEFNQQYNNEIVRFSSSIKTEILKRQSIFSDVITQCTIDINNAKYKCNCACRKTKAYKKRGI